MTPFTMRPPVPILRNPKHQACTSFTLGIIGIGDRTGSQIVADVGEIDLNVAPYCCS
jgi:hypothetical protein